MGAPALPLGTAYSTGLFPSVWCETLVIGPFWEQVDETQEATQRQLSAGLSERGSPRPTLVVRPVPGYPHP